MGRERDFSVERSEALSIPPTKVVFIDAEGREISVVPRQQVARELRTRQQWMPNPKLA